MPRAGSCPPLTAAFLVAAAFGASAWQPAAGSVGQESYAGTHAWCRRWQQWQVYPGGPRTAIRAAQHGAGLPCAGAAWFGATWGNCAGGSRSNCAGGAYFGFGSTGGQHRPARQRRRGAGAAAAPSPASALRDAVGAERASAGRRRGRGLRPTDTSAKRRSERAVVASGSGRPAARGAGGGSATRTAAGAAERAAAGHGGQDRAVAGGGGP